VRETKAEREGRALQTFEGLRAKYADLLPKADFCVGVASNLAIGASAGRVEWVRGFLSNLKAAWAAHEIPSLREYQRGMFDALEHEARRDARAFSGRLGQLARERRDARPKGYWDGWKAGLLEGSKKPPKRP